MHSSYLTMGFLPTRATWFDWQQALAASRDIPSTRTDKRKESNDQQQQQRRRQLDPSVPRPKPLQNRRNTSPNHKPRNYWKDINNIEKELREQWKSVLIPYSEEKEKKQSIENIADRLLPNDRPPPIPNDTLLAHWQRNDLSWAIRTFGRLYVAELLGGATVIPGKWKLAVREPIVKRVIQLDDNLTQDRPPPSQQQLNELKNVYNMSQQDIEKWGESERWKRRDNRRRRGFWSKEKVVEKLYV